MGWIEDQKKGGEIQGEESNLDEIKDEIKGNAKEGDKEGG